MLNGGVVPSNRCPHSHIRTRLRVPLGRLNL